MQLEFNWSRAAQLAMLRDIVLPKMQVTEGNRTIKVSPITAKATLRQIDDYARECGECRAAQATIAEKVGCSVSTVKRVLKALEALSLVTCTLQGVGGNSRVTVNHYRIVWNELALLPGFSPRIDSPRGAIDSPQAPIASPPVGYKPPPNRIKPPPPTPSEPDSEEWARVEEDFCAVGIAAVGRLVAIAKARRLTTSDVDGLVAHFREHQAASRWRPGALYSRVSNAVPGEDPAQRWPAAATVPVLVTVQGTARRETYLRWESKAAEEHAERSTLEHRFGPWLATRSAEQLAELVRQAFPNNAFIFARFTKRGVTGTVRDGVFTWLDQNPNAIEVDDVRNEP